MSSVEAIPIHILTEFFSQSLMDTLLSYDAIIFPADGRPPHLIDLSASPVSQTDPFTGQLILVSVLPHPEVHMDNIADNMDRRAWRWQVNIKLLKLNCG